MNIAFAGFRHSHIWVLYDMAKKREDICITGCFEENKEAKRAAEQNYGVTFTYQSYKELLEDSKVDAVAIGDYYGKRGSMVIEALQHGKHVICDKPICTDLEELAEIECLAAEKHLQVGCMLDLRYMNQAERVKEILANEELGTLKIISFTGQHCLDYGNRPGWYFEPGKHGGTINDIAIHGIDLVRMLTGKNVTKVNHAMTWNAFAEKEPDFKDSAQFSVMLEDVVLTADVSYAAPKYQGILHTYWDFKFWGTKGMLEFNLADPFSIRIYKDTKETIICEKCAENHLNDFIKEIQGGTTRLKTGDILKSQCQVLEIQKAAD